MAHHPPDPKNLFEKADRDHTGNAINARTDEMKTKLEQETAQLRDKYVDQGTDEDTTQR